MVIYDNQIESTFDAVDQAVHTIEIAIAKHCPSFDSSALFKINFMLREMLNNAVEHGNKFDVQKKVTCKIQSFDDRVVFNISDEGDGIALNTYFDDDIKLQDKDRNRGYATVKQLDFGIDIKGNTVSLTLGK